MAGLGARSLAELERKDPPPGDWIELVDHWIHVIDSWVHEVDQGMGGAADGAGPAAMLDSAPEPTRTTPPAADAE
jgi:hypothetical protein